MFKGNEDEGDILEKIKQIELQESDLMASMQRLENLMNLIIQLLSKDG